MANLGNRKKLQINRKDRTTDTDEINTSDVKKQERKESHSRNILLSDEDNNDLDDEIVTSAGKSDNSKNKIILIFGGVFIVIIVFILFFLFMSGKNEPTVSLDDNPMEQTSQEDLNEDNSKDGNLGTQNFLDNTTMLSGSKMEDPDNFTKDLYGLTTRVDYTVNNIQSVADFVSYTKHRGTWGGGLELYYLECTYKNSKYVVQVPFQYYKELDDSGIIPVKMEVLRIADNTSDTGYLTIISYMCLDADTLNTILKSQNK